MILNKSKIAAQAILIKLKYQIDRIFLRRNESFKILDFKDFELLAELSARWFNFSKESIFKDPEYKELINKINNYPMKYKTLYRGVSFKTKGEFDKFMKAKKITTREFASYTSDIQVANAFAKGEWNNGKYYAILEIPKSQVKEHLVFSLESLFENEADRKLFLTKIVQLDSKHNINHIARNKLKNITPNALTGSIRGAYFAVTESEYILLATAPFKVLETYETDSK